jgi:hypothetical protein
MDREFSWWLCQESFTDERDYFSPAYSAFACCRIGISGSAPTIRGLISRRDLSKVCAVAGNLSRFERSRFAADAFACPKQATWKIRD